MIKMTCFPQYRQSNPEKLCKDVSSWLKRVGDIEILGIGQSADEYGSLTITVWYKEAS